MRDFGLTRKHKRIPSHKDFFLEPRCNPAVIRAMSTTVRCSHGRAASCAGTAGHRRQASRRVALRAAVNVRASLSSAASQPQQEDSRAQRRTMLLGGMALLSAASLRPAQAAVEAPLQESRFVDSVENFSLLVPNDWEMGEGAINGNSSFQGSSGARRTLVWFPRGANARDANISLVITNVSVEFTRLGSFGSAYQFGTNLVNSQDRSFLLRQPEWARKSNEPIQIAVLVDAKEAKNMYEVEYTVKKGNEDQRHLYSLVALKPSGRYNRLYTLTAQCLEKDLPQLQSTLVATLQSFSPTAA